MFSGLPINDPHKVELYNNSGNNNNSACAGRGFDRHSRSACLRQAGRANRNDDRLPECVYSPVVIPAKAGIQEGDAGG